MAVLALQHENEPPYRLSGKVVNGYWLHPVLLLGARIGALLGMFGFFCEISAKPDIESLSATEKWHAQTEAA